MHDRQTYRDIIEKTGMSFYRVRRFLREGLIHRVTSHTKPSLTANNRAARLKYCKSFIDKESGRFDDFMYRINIDEKLFNLCKVKSKYYLLPGEKTPLRVAKSKRFIEKIMFLCAVARPRHDTTNNTLFDGKLGIWPFVEEVAAQRSSRNRPAGTMETKSVSVKRHNFREMLIDKLLPAIMEKWPPAYREHQILIQQDNATPHCEVIDEEFGKAVDDVGWDIKLVCQPPNSPDLNVLDLGYFAAIQCLQYKKNAKNVNELIQAVYDSFDELGHHKLNNIFLTLQGVMEQIILNDGGNDYKLPHMNKAKLARNNELPLTLIASDDVRMKIYDDNAAAEFAVAPVMV